MFPCSPLLPPSTWFPPQKVTFSYFKKGQHVNIVENLKKRKKIKSKKIKTHFSYPEITTVINVLVSIHISQIELSSINRQYQNLSSLAQQKFICHSCKVGCGFGWVQDSVLSCSGHFDPVPYISVQGLIHHFSIGVRVFQLKVPSKLLCPAQLYWLEKYTCLCVPGRGSELGIGEG